MLILFVHHLDKCVQPHLIITESRPLKRLLDLVGQLVVQITDTSVMTTDTTSPWTQEVFKNNRNIMETHRFHPSVKDGSN